MTPPKKRDKVKVKKVRAWAGFTDGKMYLSYNGEYDKQEYCIYKTKWRAKMDFEDVRPVTITYKSGNGR